MKDYRALRFYNGVDARSYEERRFARVRGRIVDHLEWGLLARGLRMLMSQTGRLATVGDIPIGTGRMGVRLRMTGLHVVGVDASSDMLSVARAKNAANEYVLGRVEQLSSAVAPVDCIVSLRLFGHLPGDVQAVALREIREVANYGCVVCYAADTRWLRIRRWLQGLSGRTLSGWTALADADARRMAESAGFDVLGILRLLGPISETHAMVLRCSGG